MKRLSLSLASAVLMLGSARCAINASDTVTITKNDAAISACSRLSQVNVPSGTPDSGRNFALAEAAYRGGANTVLVTSDEARTGVAYRCGSPSLAAR